MDDRRRPTLTVCRVGLVVSAFFVWACTPAPTSTSAASTVPPTTSPITTIAPSTTVDERAPPRVELIPLGEMVTGDAPIVVSGLDRGAISAFELTSDLDQYEAAVLPEGTSFRLLDCRIVYPGVAVFEGEFLAEPSVKLPVEVGIHPLVVFGDVGLGTLGIAELLEPGRFQIEMVFGEWLDLFGEGRQEDHPTIHREKQLLEPGVFCSLGFPGEPRYAEGHPPARLDPIGVESTAPGQTVEGLAQAVDISDPEAPLLPLAVSYGEGIRLFADRLFLPEDPPALLSVSETLRSDPSCLDVEMRFFNFHVVQNLGCVPLLAPALWEAGDNWFATTNDGQWSVLVSGRDQQEVARFTNSLKPFWNLLAAEFPDHVTIQTQAGDTAADIEVIHQPCVGVPPQVQDYTDADPLAQACTTTPAGPHRVVLFIPNEMFRAEMKATSDDFECLAITRPGEAGIGCHRTDTAVATTGTSGSGELWMTGTLVPAETTEVVAVTQLGLTIRSIPLNRLAVVWWPQHQGRLLELQAVTPDGVIDLQAELTSQVSGHADSL